MIRYTLMMLVCAALGGALFAADELTTTDGDKLVGTFEKLEGGEVHFKTTSSGVVKVPAAKVATLTLEKSLDARIRSSDDLKDQKSVKLASKGGKLVVTDELGERETELSRFKGINEALPDERPVWDLSALGLLSWTEGNTETVSLGYRFDLKRTAKHNFQHLFARGSYLQDRTLEEDSVRERNHQVGYLYRYIFDFGLTIELTQDFYFNELGGYHYRSVTGLGPGYYILRQEKLWWYAAAHLTYTHEDLINGGEDRGYLGARARTEADWKGLGDSLHVNAKSEILFDFDETKNLQVNNALLVEYKFASYFSAGMLVEHWWDNIPAPGFDHHDFRFTFTLGFAWSGRWV
ncbi:MAG: DUF481 domain-containing protein [Planctomycetes bacterium]|nr:DUF481 domain-containing protein [Planctomycetota bacterium]